MRGALKLALFPALFVVALFASNLDWLEALVLSLLLGFVELIKRYEPRGLLDLFDRTTFAFGLAVGIPFGHILFRHVDGGEAVGTAVLSSILGKPGFAALVVLGASTWVRHRLMRQSARARWRGLA